MISEYRRKIETYETMIAEWERELGGAALSPHGAENGAIGTKKPAPGGDLLASVRDYQFFGKSQPEAAKMLLEMVGHPVKTPVILGGLEKGGVTVGGKTTAEKKQNLYTILRRSKEFGRVGRDTWGLIGWPGVKKKSESSKDDEGETEEAGGTEETE